jgi:predicted RNase H-like HicB family nuclease
MKKINIEYTVQIWKEGNQYVAHAMPLDVMSSGKTPEKARKALDEAVHLFLMTAVDIEILDEILKVDRYQQTDRTWESSPWVGIEKN